MGQLIKAFEPTRDTRYVVGPYNESLRGGARFAAERGMKPAIYVDVDCDMYSGARVPMDTALS